MDGVRVLVLHIEIDHRPTNNTQPGEQSNLPSFMVKYQKEVTIDHKITQLTATPTIRLLKHGSGGGGAG